jgi:hypothetical protein
LNVGPCLSLAGVRARFPKAPGDMAEDEVRLEIVRLGYSIMWAAFRGRVHEVCVCMVRLRELVEEGYGKPFDHGDHWT